MARILDGKEVAASINENLHARSDALRGAGVFPTLAVLRVGERADDVSYETNAKRRAERCGVEVQSNVLPADCTQEQIEHRLAELNGDATVHGILILSPLPAHLDLRALTAKLDPAKDVDGITARSIARALTIPDGGYPPCTAQACMEILDHYGIDVDGANVTVIGRSPVVGRPLAVLLIDRSATVTICHTHTVDMPSIARRADILVVAAGKAGMIGAEYASPGQVVVDVGISWDAAAQRLRGDVLFDEVEPIVGMITPVPGGVGSVTTSVLMSHVIEAAEKALARDGNG